MLGLPVEVKSLCKDCDATVADLLGEASEPTPSFMEIDTAMPSSRHHQRISQQTQAAWPSTDSSIASPSTSSMRSLDPDFQFEALGMNDSRTLESGILIATVSENSLPNDLDYEIFRVDTVDRKVNCITIPGIGGPDVMYPKRIATAVADCKVLAATGTGTIKGSMISNAYYIRLEHSSTYQELWAVQLERETSRLALVSL